MSRARKGLRAPTKKPKRTKVNPRRRAGLRAGEALDEITFIPTAAERAELESLFGPMEGNVLVSMSSNLKR